jgi:hypothetical protein
MSDGTSARNRSDSSGAGDEGGAGGAGNMSNKSNERGRSIGLVCKPMKRASEQDGHPTHNI